jgi:hypothetical protein
MKKETLNGVIAGSVILALGMVAYLVFNKKDRNPSPMPPNPNPDPFGGANGEGGNVSNLDYRKIADNLFDAMDGYGTGNNTIETELKKLKSKSDWDALVRAYGTRTISSGIGNIFVSDFTGDLPACLNDELDSDELEDANEILNKIGVTI